jgi:hypothetical protein
MHVPGSQIPPIEPCLNKFTGLISAETSLGGRDGRDIVLEIARGEGKENQSGAHLDKAG